jgi:hypothetical protein
VRVTGVQLATGGGKSECELYGADEADERGKQGQGERFDATEIDL